MCQNDTPVLTRHISVCTSRLNVGRLEISVAGGPASAPFTCYYEWYIPSRPCWGAARLRSTTIHRGSPQMCMLAIQYRCGHHSAALHCITKIHHRVRHRLVHQRGAARGYTLTGACCGGYTMISHVCLCVIFVVK